MKVRYLEEQALVAPRRTKGGYRLYSRDDYLRLVRVLTMQRDEYLPLKVIRKRGLLKPGGLIVLRHFYKIKPRLGDFKLERRVVLGDDVLALFSPSAPQSGAEDPPPVPNPRVARAARPPRKAS